AFWSIAFSAMRPVGRRLELDGYWRRPQRGFTHRATWMRYGLKLFALLGGDPARIYMEPRPRTTFEDALYAAALLKPKLSESWFLVTSASYVARSRMLSGGRISSGALSGTSNRPIASIRLFLSWYLSLD